jgi:hypothetical protein
MAAGQNTGKVKRKTRAALKAYSREGIDLVKQELISRKTWSEP